MGDKIRTLHPRGKAGVNISSAKYMQIEHAIKEVLNENKMVPYKELNHLVELKLEDRFEGSIPWYVVVVKLDMEARGIVERLSSRGDHSIKFK